MKLKYSFALLLLFTMAISCSNNKQEKYQPSRNNIQNIKDKVVIFEPNSILIGDYPLLYVADNYLIISDYKSLAEHLHFFEKNSFKYITSTALRGEGPDEITRLGHVVYDKKRGNIYVSDHGKNKIFSYNIDSLVSFKDYKHYEKSKLKNRQFPAKYYYVNDSLSYAQIISPTGNSGYNEIVAKWSYASDKTIPLYQHPKIEKRRVVFTVSLENKIYVECYLYHDLLTICDLDGNLIHNVYGPNWDDKKSNKTIHFGRVIITKKNIVTSYSGGKNFSTEQFPAKLLVFNLNGDYIKTLEVGYHISDMCFDEESNRLFFSFNDMIQFGYLELTDDMLK